MVRSRASFTAASFTASDSTDRAIARSSLAIAVYGIR
jgi:hypothetical protein